MKIITLPNGKKKTMYKPHEVAAMLGYHSRTVRRLINDGRIKAVDTNKGGKQPVWWITEEEITRQKSLQVETKAVHVDKKKKPSKSKVKLKKKTSKK